MKKINKCGCGGSVSIYENMDGHAIDSITLMCDLCGNNLQRDTEHEAISAWNTAHPDVSELQQRIAELERENANLKKVNIFMDDKIRIMQAQLLRLRNELNDNGVWTPPATV